MSSVLALVSDGHDEHLGFTEFYDAHYRRLVRFAAHAFPRLDAEEIAQETLARVFVRFDSLRPGVDPWPWLTTIARNISRDMLRASTRTVPIETGSLVGLPCTSTQSPVDCAERNETAREVARVLGELTGREQRLLQMRDVDEMSCGEIADFLGVTSNTARQQVFRARRALAAAYLRVLGAPGAMVFPAFVALRAAWRRTRALTGASATSSVAFAGLTLATAVGIGTAGLLQLRDAPTVAVNAKSQAWSASTPVPDAAREIVLPTRTPVRPTAGTPTQRPVLRRPVAVKRGPVDATVSVRGPLARGETHRTRIVVDTRLGAAYVEQRGETREGTRPVCDAQLVIRCEG